MTLMKMTELDLNKDSVNLKMTDFIKITFFITNQSTGIAKQCSASLHIALQCRLFGCYTPIFIRLDRVTKNRLC